MSCRGCIVPLHDDALVHISSVAAQMLFCFEGFNAATSTCDGNLLGVVNTAADCCLLPPRGLGGGGYVPAGSEECTSCMTFVGKDHSQHAVCACEIVGYSFTVTIG